MFKVIIFGGRNFKDYSLLKTRCDLYLKNIDDEIEIVSGKQCSEDKDGNKWGADFLGEKYAAEKGYPVKPFPADWKKFGKSAGPIRNREMGAYGDAGIGFWDGHSPGTKDMISVCKEKKLLLKVVYYKL